MERFLALVEHYSRPKRNIYGELALDTGLIEDYGMYGFDLIRLVEPGMYIYCCLYCQEPLYLLKMDYKQKDYIFKNYINICGPSEGVHYLLDSVHFCDTTCAKKFLNEFGIHYNFTPDELFMYRVPLKKKDILKINKALESMDLKKWFHKNLSD